MSKKQILILTCLFVAIVALAFIQKYVDNMSYSQKNEQFLSVNTGLVDKINLIFPDQTAITMTKTGNNWDIIAPVSAKADNEKVQELLDNAKNIVTTGIISTNKEKAAEFEVNAKGTHVEFYQNNEKKTGFFVGKISDDYTHTYIRNDMADTTYLAKGILQSNFQLPLLSLRDKTITKLKPEEVAEIILKSDTNKLTLSNQNNIWESTPKTDATNETLQSVVTSLLSINAENIPTSAPIKRENLMSKADIKLFIRRTNADLKSTILYIKSQDGKTYAAEESSTDIYELNSTIKEDIGKIFK